MSLAVDTISIASRMLLEKHGLPEGAYRTKELVGTPVRADCLSKGECDAVPLGQPDDILFMRKGYNKLGDSLEVIPALQFGVIAARRDWAQENRDAVMRLTRAVGGAYKFMRDKANREEVAKLAADVTGAPLDVMQAVLAFYYEPDRGVMPRQGEIDMAGVAKVIELLGRTGELKPRCPPPSASSTCNTSRRRGCSSREVCSRPLRGLCGRPQGAPLRSRGGPPPPLQIHRRSHEVALAELDAAVAQDVVGGGAVEIEIRQHMIEKQPLPGELALA